MKILICYRPEEGGKKKLLELAAKHAKGLGGSVLLVTSMQGEEKIESLNEFVKLENELEKVKEFFEKQGISAEAKIQVSGLTPAEDIINVSKSVKADEIIIGIRRRSKVGKLVFGSTAQFVILEADCPVLCAR